MIVLFKFYTRYFYFFQFKTTQHSELINHHYHNQNSRAPDNVIPTGQINNKS
jgi:hypothetical protein